MGRNAGWARIKITPRAKEGFLQVRHGGILGKVVHEFEKVLVAGATHSAQGGIFDLAGFYSDGVASEGGEKGLIHSAAIGKCLIDCLRGHFPKLFSGNAKILVKGQHTMVGHATQMFMQLGNQLLWIDFTPRVQDRTPLVPDFGPRKFNRWVINRFREAPKGSQSREKRQRVGAIQAG
jgi:hypothetical protein